MKQLSLDALGREMQDSMKSGDKLRVATLKLLMSAIKNAQVAKRGDLTDDESIEVVSREFKKRQEAAQEYRKAGREDRASAEEAEAEILKEWMPQQLSSEEVQRLVDEAVTETGAATPAEMGKVMGVLMPKLKGKADGKLVSELVRKKLGGA
ncbi:MAG: GatB/YqeY domain-containing protein [Actinobacteria bacterium]|nr:GatB/YqeY domain-containing protein [Actinomycetota bacterium]